MESGLLPDVALPIFRSSSRINRTPLIQRSNTTADDGTSSDSSSQAMLRVQAPETYGQRSDLRGHPIQPTRNSSGYICPAWAQDLSHFDGKLSEADIALLDQHVNSKPLTTDVLLASTLCCIETYDRKWFQETLRRLEPLFSHVKSFSSVVDVFVQTNPTIPGLIWGSLHLAITVGLYDRL